MDTWILQGGYPLITVKGDTIAQEPFAYSESTGSSAIGSAWKVPVLARSLDSGKVIRHLLDSSTASIDLDGVTVVNARGNGFYRTAYDADHLAQIAERLGDLDELERAVLFTDTWASILVGRSDFADLLALAKGLAELDEPAAWDVVRKALSLADYFVDEPGRDALAGAVRALWRPVFARLGWEPVPGESTQASQLRGMSIRDLGTLGRDGAVIAEAVARFDAENVSGDLADAIVAITLAQGRPGDAAICHARRKDAATPQDEQRYLFAPSNSPHEEVILETFESAFGEVRTQDAPYVVMSLIRNRVAGSQVWRALTGRWNEAIERFPVTAHVGMVSSVFTFADDPAFAVEVRRFHEDNPVPVGQQQLAQILDVMDLHVALARRTRPTIEAALRAIGD
jgi:puromycin-sensitive aminopeptidase